MISSEREKQIEIQRQEIITVIDPILDKVCEANDYELYGGIEKTLDCDLSGFKSFELETLEKIQAILKTKRITKRIEKEDKESKHKEKGNKQTISTISPIPTDSPIKSKRAYALTFYKDGMSVKELSSISGIAYMYCYNALKSINKV